MQCKWRLKWHRLMEAGAVVIIIAITLAPTQTQRTLLYLLTQGFPGDVQSLTILLNAARSDSSKSAVSQFSAAPAWLSGSVAATARSPQPATLSDRNHNQ